MTERIRNWKFDILRIGMSIMVVLLHAAAYGCYDTYAAKTPVLYNSLGRIAVPVFYMVTGAISFPKMEGFQKHISGYCEELFSRFFLLRSLFHYTA
ncbi:MAG: hypothetical protein VB099_15445 [Candidatus Limiplasma sp.]|nr:hypothetical protein [Candidatus Limiplasma sp.]